MLERIRNEQTVDIYGYVTMLRSQRRFMVQNDVSATRKLILFSHESPQTDMYHSFLLPYVSAANNILLSGNLANGEKIVCEMKVLFAIAYIQYTIGLQLYLLKFEKVQ